MLFDFLQFPTQIELDVYERLDAVHDVVSISRDRGYAPISNEKEVVHLANQKRRRGTAGVIRRIRRQ